MLVPDPQKTHPFMKFGMNSDWYNILDGLCLEIAGGGFISVRERYPDVHFLLPHLTLIDIFLGKITPRGE